MGPRGKKKKGADGQPAPVGGLGSRGETLGEGTAKEQSEKKGFAFRKAKSIAESAEKRKEKRKNASEAKEKRCGED